MKNLIYLFFALVVFSCKNQPKAEVAEEPAQEMATMEKTKQLHDLLMEDMNRMVDMELKLELASKDSIPELLERQKRVTAANKEMFDWMMDFGQKFTADEIQNGAALTPEKQELLEEYYQRLVALDTEYTALRAEDQ